jgi:hypothetical protein
LVPANNPDSAPEAFLCLLSPPGTTCPNYYKPDAQGCPVTINIEQACYSEAYENNNMLCLNLCLQCDECYNAPKLVQVGGRLRRNSGIKSGILRPGQLVPNITINYGLCVA